MARGQSGALNLNVNGPLSNQNLGLIHAATQLTISSSGLNNQNGSLLVSAIALDFGAATGDLYNQGGEISSAQSYALAGRTLDNSTGDLISNGQLTLDADTLINQNCLLSGWQGLNVSGASLNNCNTGTLCSRGDDVNVNLRGHCSTVSTAPWSASKP
ncbi:adhesin HecA-like repeat protein [Pseudomonas sp. 3296]|uniref:hypothetical protein n=1 Tax=Pseudomonas sp. 3296 TaxID=2817753 RepID=UPI00285F576C|nr:hypothetical protein [Pseudomonas sp. 3296]MDR6919094.1 adhesin HecA-like repeat protein [Pseudomonas sp. 3296]